MTKHITIELSAEEIAATHDAITHRILLLGNERVGLRASGREEIDTLIDTLDDVIERLREVTDDGPIPGDDNLAWCSWHAPWGEPKACLTLAELDSQNGPGDDVLCADHQTEAWAEHEGELQGDLARDEGRV